jgi:hypothetical protein
MDLPSPKVNPRSPVHFLVLAVLGEYRRDRPLKSTQDDIKRQSPAHDFPAHVHAWADRRKKK